MRITLINQFYPPELAPTGHMVASLAHHRAQQGDSITVVTGRGGYVSETDQPLSYDIPNLVVFRLWTPRLGKSRTVNRILDYAIFYLGAFLRMLTLPRQDVIISLTTPPFIAWTAVFHKWWHRSTRVILWNMDCYPDIAEQTGVIRPGGAISKILRAMNRRLFAQLDHVICLDSAMSEVLRSQYAPGQEPPSFHIIPNWEPSAQFPLDLTPPVWVAAPSFPVANPWVVLYLGNAGFGHRFETVINAAAALKNEPFVFLFVGGGQQWPWLADAARERGLSNIILRPYVSKEVTPSVMALADCALITLRDRALGLISPSKMHANLAMSLPVVYVGPEKSNVDEAIKTYGFGCSLRHGDVGAMVKYLRDLRSDPKKHKEARIKARAAFDGAFNDVQTLPHFDALLDAATR